MWFEQVLGKERPFENAIETVLLERSQSKSDKNKRIRVSELSRLCPRQLVLMQLLNIPIESKPSITRGLAFEVGKFLHEVFQQKVLPSFYLLGNWISCNGTVVEGLKPQGMHHCGFSCWQYKELEFKYSLGFDWELVGHIDGIVMYKDQWILIDLKTMDGDIFRTVEQPLNDHIIQLQVYFYLIKQSVKYPFTSTAKIIYVNKDFGKKYKCECGKMFNNYNRLLKSFVVEYDEAVGKKYIDNAKSIVEIYEKKLPHRVCDTVKQGLTQYKCSVASQCFSDILCSSLQINDDIIKNLEGEKYG